MNNPVISLINGAVNFVPPWIMLAVFGAIILFIIIFILFKGFKRGIKFIVLGLILMAAAYLAYLTAQIFMWEDPLEIIAFFVSWGPTALFVLIVLTATLINAKRGLRKSLILSLHAVCAGAFSIAFFFICVSVKEVDYGVVNFANAFLGEEGLQKLLGVDAPSGGLKEILAKALPQLIDAESDLGILISSNTAYLYTLVDMAFKIIFALIAQGIYFFLIIVLYFVYLFCYSQRKYKRTKIAEFQNGMSDRNYRKHHLGGGAVGLVRGLAAGLLAMSFLGTAFYVVAGGKGDGELDDYDFGNDNYNNIYSVYRSFESYGAQGIFKVLNALSDAADTPYYLFAADLIFSGELTDEDAGISQDIKFREEFGALTGFARETFDLLMRYGEDELKSVINGEAGDGAFDSILGVMARPDFRREFDGLIDAFDSQTYVINLSLSLVNSIVNNIDELSFTSSVGEDEKELVKLLFKKGYLSPSIPDERKMIESGTITAEGEAVRPYLNVGRLIEKKDIKIALNIALTLIAEENAADDTAKLIKRILPEIANLSILRGGRNSEMDPVLGRLYCLAENKYLTVEGQDGVSYSDIAADNIEWVKEINVLLDVGADVIDLYNNVIDDGKEGKDILLYMFDESNPDYAENMRLYDSVCVAVTDSRVLGRALASSLVYTELLGALKGVSENVYLSKDINYSNVYDKDGNLVRSGETYLLLNGVKFLAGPENKDILDKLLNYDENTQITELLEIMSDAVSRTDEHGNTISHYLTESEILRAVLSISLIEVEGNTFYVPKASLEKDENGVEVALINKPELKDLLDNMDSLVKFVMPFVGDDDSEWQGTIDDVLLGENGEDSEFYKMVVRNRIFEGTVAQILNVKLQEDILVVPNSLTDNIDGWVTIDGRKGELIRLLESLKIANFSVASILSGGSFDGDGAFKDVMALSEDELEIFLGSTVLHYTISDYILTEGKLDLGDFNVVVPLASRQTLPDETKSLIKKSELIKVFSELDKLGLDSGNQSGFDISDILVRLAKDRSILSGSNIISASIVCTITERPDIADDLLSVPQSLKMAGTRAELAYYDDTNPWRTELQNLLDALDEILGLRYVGDTFNLNETVLSDAISGLLQDLNGTSQINPDRTKLGVCYDSEIFRNKMTVELDGVFANIVSPSALSEAKYGSYYKIEELQTLSNALEVFEIENILNIDEAVLIEKVKAKVPQMNAPLGGEFGESSMLDVVYPSAIISYVISDELDKTFEQNALIDANVLAQIKDFEKVYKKQELSSFADAFNELGLDSLDSIDGFGYKDLFTFNQQSSNPDYAGMTKLNVIYSSDLAAALITEAVSERIESNSVLRDHPKAYRKDLKIFNESEIQSIIDILGDGETDKINLEKVGECVYDENGDTNSYIVVASVSEQMLKSQALIIPPEAVETFGGVKYILPCEIKNIVDVYCEYNATDIEDWENVTLTLPNQAVRQKMYASEVLRARIIYQLTRDSDAAGLAVNSLNCRTFRDMSENEVLAGVERITVSARQLEALVDALILLNGGQQDGVEFKVPEFTPLSVGQIANSLSIQEFASLFSSDIIRYEICNAVIPLIRNKVNVLNERAMLLKAPYNTVTVETASAEEVYNALRSLVA